MSAIPTVVVREHMTEPRSVQWALITVTILFLAVFLLWLPLSICVCAKAFSKGWAALHCCHLRSDRAVRGSIDGAGDDHRVAIEYFIRIGRVVGDHAISF